MRFELAGSLIRPDPLILAYSADDSFNPKSYIDLGYTHFEVICIGGGGGHGGGIDTSNTGTLIRSHGGAGGGGGYHRVRGLLSALPDNCVVVVGSGGTSGVGQTGNPPNLAAVTDGGDGEASTFNGTTCRASGGKGGRRVQTNSDTVSSAADGGDGGVGNRVIAGGGGLGGTAGTPSPTGPGTPGTSGVDGTIFNNIGKGGGGGAGGVGKYSGVTCVAATSGGRGSYNPGDTAVYGPGDAPHLDGVTAAVNVMPGGASGAKAAPLNGLPTVFGKSSGTGLDGSPGAVIIRLSADVVSQRTSEPPVSSNSYGVVARPFTFGKSVVAVKKTYGQIARSFALNRDVSGQSSNPSFRQTAIAQISLASHGVPAVRTNHQLVFKARTTTGSGGVLKAALYEGAVNRSGDLTSNALSNTLTEYTLNISAAAAATITDYSNLSIKFWGYDAGGTGLVFEVSEVYLKLPASSVKQTPVAEISLASHAAPAVRTNNHTLKVRARTTSGAGGILKAALYEGATKRSDLQTTALTTSLADYSLAIPTADAQAITSYANLSVRLWGYDASGIGLVFEVSRLYLELPSA